jgi:hypothetical protein
MRGKLVMATQLKANLNLPLIRPSGTFSHKGRRRFFLNYSTTPASGRRARNLKKTLINTCIQSKTHGKLVKISRY